MDLVEAVRMQALLSIEEADFDYTYRKICRWYSFTFHTPLPMVEELPIPLVLQHYFEHTYEQINEHEYERVLNEAIETPEEREVRKQVEHKLSDEEFLKRAAEESKRKQEEAIKKKQQVIEQANLTVQKMADQEMVKAPEPPPITMVFDDSGNLSEEDSLPAPPPRKR